MNYDMEKTGQRIQQLRIQHRYTQKQLADRLNIDRSFLSRVEAGEKGCSVDLLIQLSDCFEVSLDYIVMGKGDVVNKEQVKSDIENLIRYLETFLSKL